MKEISSNDKNDISSRIDNDDFSDFSSKKNINFNSKLISNNFNISNDLSDSENKPNKNNNIEKKKLIFLHQIILCLNYINQRMQ